MRCRRCHARFKLGHGAERIRPSLSRATPRELLLVFGILFAGSLQCFLLVGAEAEMGGIRGPLPLVAIALFFVTLIAFLSWVLTCLGWRADSDEAGRCPHCGQLNRIWPWSA